MKEIIINEYNVTPYKEQRYELEIIIQNNVIVYYDKKIENKLLLEKINKIIEDNMDEIKNISKIRAQVRKGARQKIIHIIDGENKYYICGNTSTEDSNVLYQKLSNEIIKTIKEYI